jgi:hypothetical protein
MVAGAPRGQAPRRDRAYQTSLQRSETRPRSADGVGGIAAVSVLGVIRYLRWWKPKGPMNRNKRDVVAIRGPT